MDLFTPKQVAQALGVSEASVKRWCDKGTLRSSRTAGGHRRIPLQAVLIYLRTRAQPPARPELLGLPASTGHGTRGLNKCRGPLREALEAGDLEQATAIVLNLYLGGFSTDLICDRCVAAVLHEIGEGWLCGEVAIYQERRGCGIAEQAVRTLGQALPGPPPNAPRALGGALSGDSYSIPTCMVEIVLREHSWRAQSLGVDLPASTLHEALERERPQLLWLSVSALADEDHFLREYRGIYLRARQLDVPVVVGGRALNAKLRARMSYTAFCDTLGHLVSIADTIAAHPAAATPGESS